MSDKVLVIDLDYSVCEVHGHTKHCAAYGSAKQLGCNPLPATRAGNGEILFSRMRTRSAESSRGVVRFVDELAAFGMHNAVLEIGRLTDGWVVAVEHSLAEGAGSLRALISSQSRPASIRINTVSWPSSGRHPVARPQECVPLRVVLTRLDPLDHRMCSCPVRILT